MAADCDRRVQAAVGLVLDIGAQEGSGEHTASAAIDAEHRRAVASELAGLIREDAGQRLEAIAARNDDPEVRRAVAECADEVARSTQGLARGFEGAGHSGSS